MEQRGSRTTAGRWGSGDTSEGRSRNFWTARWRWAVANPVGQARDDEVVDGTHSVVDASEHMSRPERFGLSDERLSANRGESGWLLTHRVGTPSALCVHQRELTAVWEWMPPSEGVVERHRSASTVLTSNRDPSEWLAVMADPLLAQSAVDRMKSAAWELVIEGESYRKNEKPALNEDSAKPPSP